jgi:hypothetical protein
MGRRQLASILTAGPSIWQPGRWRQIRWDLPLATGYSPGVRLHPNPPRLITVAIAVALAVVGVVLALPVPAAIDLLRPVTDVTASFGLGATAETGWLCRVV